MAEQGTDCPGARCVGFAPVRPEGHPDLLNWSSYELALAKMLEAQNAAATSPEETPPGCGR
jgi:hypothetical protein